MSIGFIGLGNLGKAISSRLRDVGEEVIVYNRNADKIKDLGYEIALTPKELLKKCDTIFMCLFDSPAVNNIFSMPSYNFV